MLADVNVLLNLWLTTAPHHPFAVAWLQKCLTTGESVGLPWHSIVGFLRLSTSPRAVTPPITPDEAWAVVESWLQIPGGRIVLPGQSHSRIFRTLSTEYGLRGDDISDAHLAALAIEHNLALASFDHDFARFAELTWVNPAAP